MVLQTGGAALRAVDGGRGGARAAGRPLPRAGRRHGARHPAAPRLPAAEVLAALRILHGLAESLFKSNVMMCSER